MSGRVTTRWDALKWAVSVQKWDFFFPVPFIACVTILALSSEDWALALSSVMACLVIVSQQILIGCDKALQELQDEIIEQQNEFIQVVTNTSEIIEESD